MDESQKYTECHKPDTEEFILYYSIYIKSKNKQNKIMVDVSQKSGYL